MLPRCTSSITKSTSSSSGTSRFQPDARMLYHLALSEHSWAVLMSPRVFWSRALKGGGGVGAEHREGRGQTALHAWSVLQFQSVKQQWVSTPLRSPCRLSAYPRTKRFQLICNFKKAELRLANLQLLGSRSAAPRPDPRLAGRAVITRSLHSAAPRTASAALSFIWFCLQFPVLLKHWSWGWVKSRVTAVVQ